jgi:hypothetical protein
MRLPLRILALVALTLAPVASAQQYKRPLKKAVEALDDAAKQAKRGGAQCKQAVYGTLDDLSDKVEDLKKEGMRPRDAAQLKFEISNVASTASWSGCPDGVIQSIHLAGDFVEEVRTTMAGDRRDDRRDDRRNDDDDNQYQAAQMGPLQVQLNSSIEGEPAVKVMVPELTLRNMRGQNFYLAARYRSFQGHWSEWVTTQQWSVPSDPFVWKNPFSHFFRYSTLAEDDFSGGRFIARISLFDAGGRELAFREVNFTANRLPQLPPAPVVVVQQPPPMQNRDCGTGPDVGCSMARDGRYPMDAATFQGFMRSLQATTSEMMRGQTVQTMFANNYVTAVQFGLVLDLFQSEMFKLQVAQQGAPRLVNPQHAIGYADKFGSNMYRTSYTQLMAQQMGGGQPMNPNRPPPPPPPGGGYQQPPPPPPPPGGGYQQPPPPPPPPGAGPRDCGTGPQDPGCNMRRNGMWAMDAMAWGGFYNSMRGQPNELVRQSMAQQALQNQALTAAQLGLLMDLFQNELTRLDVAKFAATRVVNPMHAIGLSAKFRNSILQQDYVTVMGRQQ